MKTSLYLPMACLAATLAGPVSAQYVYDGKNPLNPTAAGEGFLKWKAEAPLFDGKSLAGWEGNTEKVWRVADGVILGGSMEGNPENEFLATEKEYRDFVLSLEYRIRGTDGFVNGGVQFRSEPAADRTNEVKGYQADLGAGYSGCLYDESRRGMLVTPDKDLIAKTEKPGDWNRYEIRCEGPRIRLSLNGVVTADYTETDPNIPLTGKIALQIHGGNKAVVEYREVKITEAEAGSDKSRPLGDADTMNRFGEWKQHAPRGPFPDGKFTLEKEETIAFLGGAREARQGERGFLEGLMARAFSKEAPRFRWMAVPGDTVYEQAREMNFGSWTGQLQWSDATVAVCRFGRMECLDGEARLPEFAAAYHRLLDWITPVTKRIVLIAPMAPDAPPGASAEEIARRAGLAAKYAEAVRGIAKTVGAVYVAPAPPTGFTLPAGLIREDAPFPGDTSAGLYTDAVAVAAALGLPVAETPAEDLLADIAEKNRLWTDCWRPDNWAFAYGDRMSNLFDKPGRNGQPFMREAYQMLKPRVAELDKRIAARVSYQPLPPVSPEPAPAPKSAPALSAAEELATFTPMEGFEANLFADENLGVVKPIQMSWDERGRLYIACSPMYPHLEPGTKPGDYILVCEDTDGDGKADKSWKFAENLTMVQGVEPGDGGLYVCDYDRLTFLKDTDGDGKADLRRVIYTGFGTGDTHQLTNSVSHGEDGALWFTQGLHNLAKVETPYGIERLERAGVWRLDPRTMKLQRYFNHYTAGQNNWGVVFDNFGQVFHKCGASADGYWSVPGLIPLENPDDYRRTSRLFVTDQKATALEWIQTAALPESFQHNAIVCGFMDNSVEVFTPEDDGAGFKTDIQRRLLKSSSTSFRPVDSSVGPDGSIYLCDFYNPIIGHYQASYRDPARDHGHGRIWRISAKGHAPVKQPALAAMDAAQLLEQLGSGERWTRNQALRLLGDLPADKAVPALKAWFASSAPRPETHLREVLCAVQALHWPADTGYGTALEKLSRSTDFRMRAYVARIAGETPVGQPILDRLLRDEHPRVRLCAVVSLAQNPTAESAKRIEPALDLPRDRFLDYSLTMAYRYILASVPVDTIPFAKPESRDFALKAVWGGQRVKPAGQVIYETICYNCHQGEGKGIPGIYPSISANPVVNGDPDRLAKILIHGLTGPIDGFTQTAPIPMPPTGLTDQQIADVLTWLRGNLGNNASPVTPEQIRTVREANAGRTEMWTAKEL